MRVLVAVGHGGIYSGGSHQALWTLQGLNRAGIDVMAVWGPDMEGDPAGFNKLKATGIPFELIPIHKKPSWDSLRAFRKVVRAFNPDLIECIKSGAQYHTLYGGIGLNRHAIVFYRGVSRSMDYFQALKYRIRRVDRIIANCDALKVIMVKTGHISPSKIDFVHGEYDPVCSNPDDVDATGFRRELGIPEDVTLITQLGNWSGWRGQDITLKAASMLLKRGMKFHLLFAGRQTEKLSDLVSELGLQSLVTLSPYRRDPERVLKASDIAVNASTGLESLAGALINSQAMGLPAVTGFHTGSDEIVQEGITGYIVPQGDPVALADALMKMLSMSTDERKRMGYAAHLHAFGKFSSNVKTRKRLEVYERAIDHRKAVLK